MGLNTCRFGSQSGSWNPASIDAHRAPALLEAAQTSDSALSVGGVHLRQQYHRMKLHGGPERCWNGDRCTVLKREFFLSWGVEIKDNIKDNVKYELLLKQWRYQTRIWMVCKLGGQRYPTEGVDYQVFSKWMPFQSGGINSKKNKWLGKNVGWCGDYGEGDPHDNGWLQVFAGIGGKSWHLLNHRPVRRKTGGKGVGDVFHLTGGDHEWHRVWPHGSHR